MIFVTVGAQMPFDRLIRPVDAWAGQRSGRDVFAQIGKSDLRPRNIEWTMFLDPLDCRERIANADVIITHAGMGTILTALEFGKPILVMPRRADLRETRNDHQFGTSRALARAGCISVAWNEGELTAALSRLDQLPAPRRVASHASLQLLTALRTFIRGDAVLPVAPPADLMMPLKHPAVPASPAEGQREKKAA
jgi:UDP-N-acetylglucosamine transferase subunit ALG13